MDILQNKKVIAGIVAGLAAVTGYFFYQQSDPSITEEPLFAASPVVEQVESPAEEVKPLIIKIDVKGAVELPGVFIADEGDRVIDLIDDAGGFHPDADRDKVNLAQLVKDQMVIYVPKVGEETETLPQDAAATVSGPAGGDKDGGMINLNTATETELMTLTGVGPSKAAAIIEYREKSPFQSIEDLKKVSGIGDKTFEKLQDSITIK
ncbi:helix-hairpin-helix domain-containing protein [Peribacillus sp. FSL H8-0477]|uniref:helix-hairpin-helix domain-containing protein n=1 Tax=Peribacillus sp. FSL H8-0477 TaxID=2921388 RepID=UPI0030F8CB65